MYQMYQSKFEKQVANIERLLRKNGYSNITILSQTFEVRETKQIHRVTFLLKHEHAKIRIVYCMTVYNITTKPDIRHSWFAENGESMYIKLYFSRRDFIKNIKDLIEEGAS